jgi:hypothetical protein
MDHLSPILRIVQQILSQSTALWKLGKQRYPSILDGQEIESQNGSQLTRFLVCTGALDFDEGVERRALLVHLAGSLRKIDARAVTISDESVTFRGGLFRLVSSWNILMPFGSGELVVDAKKHAVRYRLFIHQFVLVVTAMTMMAFAFASPIRIIPGGLIFLTLTWLWLIGVNLLIGLPRFKRFLREAVDSRPVGRSPN